MLEIPRRIKKDNILSKELRMNTSHDVVLPELK